MSAPQTKVSVFLRDKPLHTQTLPPGTYVIGKGKDAAIRFEAEGVADRHARLTLRESEWEIEDLGGGTFVEEEELKKAAIIQPDQRIRIGEVHIELDYLEDSTSTGSSGVRVRRTSNADMHNGRNYIISRTVARGGMGVIKSAHESTLQREVAMKLMLDDSKPAAHDRFCQEAQVTAQLEHPNIVPVHELGINEDGKPFYTMKLVRGISLKRVLELLAAGDADTVRQWPLSALMTVFQKICDALAFAHSKGVIHRDLKPANIMLGEYGEALVMDWGLAKLLGRELHRTGKINPQQIADVDTHNPSDADATTMGPTLSGTVMGTPQYMPPEQANGEVEMMDERTDIYALGAILYFILTLRPPFHGRSSAEIVQNVRAGRIVPFAEACAKKRLAHWPGGRLPESLAAVALKAMSFERADRYPTVKALQVEIQAYQNGFATSAENAGAWKILGLFLRRHRTLSIAAALILLSGVVFSIYLFQARNRAEEASVQAKIAKEVANKQRDAAETQLYLSDMLQAGRQLADGRPETARQLLQRHRQEPSGRDLRDWEWFYLAGQASQDRLRVHAHTGGVLALAASADGARIATGGMDGEIALWQSRGLVPQWRVQAHPGGVLTVSWSSDGKYLATGGVDGFVRIWNVEAHKNVGELRVGVGNPVRSVAWRPGETDPPTLAIGSLEKELLLWRPFSEGDAGRPETLDTTRHGVASLHWSANGARLVAGELDADKTIEVYDFASRKKLLSTSGGPGNDVFAVALDPSGKYAAGGSKHLTVTVFEVDKQKKQYSAALHHGFISALAWRPDGRQLASASHDGTIRICTPSNSSDISQVLNGHSGEVNALAWIKLPSPDGNSGPMALFSGGSDGTLRTWLPGSSEDTSIIVKPNNWIASAQWDPSGAHIALVNFRDRVFLADPVTGLAIPVYTTHGNLFDVAWSPDGARFATASRGSGLIEVFDTATGCPLGAYSLHQAVRVAWSSSGRYLAAGGLDETRIWDTRNGTLVNSILRPTKSLIWFADEHRIALGGNDGAIQVWDAFAGTLLATWKAASPVAGGSIVSEYEPPHAIFDFRWSPDGRHLAYGAQDGLANVLDGETGALVQEFPGHSSGVWRVAWSPTGRRLATAGQDGIVRIFATDSGGRVAQITHGIGSSELEALDWSPDGQQMLSGGYDGIVRLRDAERGARIDAIDHLTALRNEHPKDVETLRKLALTYAELGWVDDARLTFGLVHSMAPDDSTARTAAADAETAFARALDTASSDWMSSPTLLAGKRHSLELLTIVNESWDSGQTEVAIAAYRELAHLPGATALLPYANSYFSRANWSVSWFTSRADPLSDLPAWRALAHESEAVNVKTQSLSFPYQSGGPKALILNPELSDRGPGADHFGMIATAKIKFPAGRWRLHASGAGGVRILADGKSLLENWTNDAPTEKFASFETPSTAEVEITVEHFVTAPTPGFQFLIEPVDN
ncbi:MAG: protein kinase [Chthoniobacter sp.]|nr:protein kinase [Chthoniobacter sp.]